MGVQTLKNLAFNVSYEEIARSSLQCENHPQRGKLSPCLPFSSVLSSSRPPLSAKEKSSRVQIHLDYYLKGIVSDEIRKQLVKRCSEDGFIKYKNPDDDVNGGHYGYCIINICSFLDSVLDESFDQLKVVFSVRGEPNPELLSIIARRSPQLEKLEIDFYYYGATCMGQVETLMGPLSSLENLTHLTLSSLQDELLRQNVLSLVGKCCPLLTHLSIEDFPDWPVGEQEILRLILGETLSSFFPNGYNDEELDHLDVPAEHLTPFCSTLRELNYFYNCYDGEEEGHTVSDSLAAFALRHLPFLEYLGPPFPTSSGIEKLCRIKSEARAKLRFQQTSRSRPAASELVLLNDRTTNIPNFLLLKKLDDVNLSNNNQLRAIGAICPNLKHVVFTMKTPWETDPDLTDIFNEWPKLTTIEFNTIYASIYHKIVLKVFGTHLKNLTFRFWSKGPVMADLTHCICLESLVFSEDCELDTDSKPPTHLSSDTFLPKLKHFTSGKCLGTSWSRLFEEKSSLVSLHLRCCHIGIGDEDASQASFDEKPSKRLKLNEEVPKTWQELETLTIRQCVGLTSTMLNLLPRLRKLKKVVLSTGIRETTDPVILNSVMEKLTQRVSPVEIDFVNHFRTTCRGLNKKEWHFN